MTSIAKQIVQQLLEDASIARVCAYCEREIGPMRVGPGQRKSHGFCRRHAREALDGMPEEEQNRLMAEFDRMPEGFPPDLAAHPELVEQ